MTFDPHYGPPTQSPDQLDSPFPNHHHQVVDSCTSIRGRHSFPATLLFCHKFPKVHASDLSSPIISR